MQIQKEKTVARIIYFGAVAAISIILAIVSMEAIKNVPGNEFPTETNYIATASLVFGLYFLAIISCVWLVKFLVNLGKSKKKVSSAEALVIARKKDKDLKTLVTVREIIVGILNVVCMYILIIFSISACVFLGIGVSTDVLVAFVLANICIILPLLVCAVYDLILALKLRRNPHDKKMIQTRKKLRKLSGIFVILFIIVYVLTFICLP